MKNTALFLLAVGLTTAQESFEPTSESFKAISSQFLSFPLIKSDYMHWKARKTAVFMKNKAVIVPEILGVTGQIMNQEKNPQKDNWKAEIDLTIGNNL